MPTGVDVPWGLFVQIGTHQYAIDPMKYSRRHLPALRSQVDQGEEPGQQSLSLEGSWTRRQTDWSLGGMQEVFDDELGDRRRYDSTLGIQPVRNGRIQLAPAMQTRSTARAGDDNCKAVMTGGFLYFTDNVASANGAIYSADISAGAYSAIAPSLALAAPASLVTGIASDSVVTTWAITAANGLYRATTAGGTLASWIGGTSGTALGFVNGRLLAGTGTGNVLAEISAGAIVTTIYTHPTAVIIQGFLATPGSIYYWTNRREIFVVDDVDSSGALSAPRVAGLLATGETVRCAIAINDVLVLGTTSGIRLVVANGDGSLTMGSPQPIRFSGSSRAGTLYSLAVNGSNVYVCWSTLGAYRIARLDLANFTGPLTPAVHPAEITSGTVNDRFKLIINGVTPTTQGDFWVIGTNLGSTPRMWAFQPDALLLEANATPREKFSGASQITSSWITFGILEVKQPVVLNVLHDALPAGSSIQAYVVKEDETQTSLGVSNTTGTIFSTFAIPAANFGPQRRFRIAFSMLRGTDTTASPAIQAWATRAIPVPQRQEEIVVPILMRSAVEAGDDGNQVFQSTLDELTYLNSLVTARTPIAYVEGTTTSTVIVDSIVWPQGEAEQIANSRDGFLGTLYVRLLTVA